MMRVSLFFILSFALTLSSCTEKYSSSQYGLSVTGKVGEIIVVCDNGIWESDAKAYLDTNLTQFIMPYFPDVVTFELVHRTPKAFESGNKSWRNLLFLSIDPNAKDNTVSVERSTWATSQLVYRIVAKDLNSLVEICKTKGKEIHAVYDKSEWERLTKRYENEKNQNISRTLVSNFGFDIALPKGSSIVSKRTNFFRIEFPTETKPLEFIGGSGGQAANFIQTGILIYQYDYIDSTQFEMSQLLKARDTMLKYNVPHETPGVYMGTQYADFVAPEGNFTKNYQKNLTVFEMRGMFKFTGNTKHGTGGSFWAYHFVNPKTKKLICVSGYVDAPNMTSWTLPLREIQAILKSIELKEKPKK